MKIARLFSREVEPTRRIFLGRGEGRVPRSRRCAPGRRVASTLSPWRPGPVRHLLPDPKKDRRSHRRARCERREYLGATVLSAKDCANPREPNLALEKAIPPPRTDDVAPVKSIVPPFRPDASISAAASRAQSRAPKTPTLHARSKIVRVQFQETASTRTATATGMIYEQIGRT